MKVAQKKSEREKEALRWFLFIAWINCVIPLLVLLVGLIVAKFVEGTTWTSVIVTMIGFVLLIVGIFGGLGLWFYHSGESFPSWVYEGKAGPRDYSSSKK